MKSDPAQDPTSQRADKGLEPVLEDREDQEDQEDEDEEEREGSNQDVEPQIDSDEIPEDQIPEARHPPAISVVDEEIEDILNTVQSKLHEEATRNIVIDVD